ncbi:hypothetical protein [Persephonella sp. IF05-L8]|uniref:hypothetical protein n=1 Tax=Persephonella sp. IF05-L8 TaxID=1158338 RepID=UPI0018CC62E6
MNLEVKEKKKKAEKEFPRNLYIKYGSPIYYKDYDKVISGEKTLEEVMGSS